MIRLIKNRQFSNLLALALWLTHQQNESYWQRKIHANKTHASHIYIINANDLNLAVNKCYAVRIYVKYNINDSPNAERRVLRRGHKYHQEPYLNRKVFFLLSIRVLLVRER